MPVSKEAAAWAKAKWGRYWAFAARSGVTAEAILARKAEAEAAVAGLPPPSAGDDAESDGYVRTDTESSEEDEYSPSPPPRAPQPAVPSPPPAPARPYQDRSAQIGAAPDAKFDGSVVWTGAFEKELIEVKRDPKKKDKAAPEGLVLEVFRGQISACSPVANFSDAAELKRIATEGLPPAQRRRMQFVKVDMGRPYNTSIGSVCRAKENGKMKDGCKKAECACQTPELRDVQFVIKEVGLLNETVLPERRAQLDEWVANETPVTWKDLRSLVDSNRYFYFSSFRFSLAEQLMPIRLGDDGAPVDATDLGLGDEVAVFPVCGRNVSVPVTMTKPYAQENKGDQVAAMLGGRGDGADAAFCIAEFAKRKWTDGLLKSLIQKVVRYNADFYVISGRKVASETVAHVAAAFLLCSRGAYSPNIHKTVRGPVACLKRVAVIAIEDGIPADPTCIESVYRLMCSAFVLDRRSDYHPTRALCAFCIDFIGQCVRSRSVIRWRADKEYSKTLRADRVDLAGNSGVGRLRALLEALGSFSGDIRMMGKVDAMKMRLAVVTCARRPAEVDVRHIIDQHTTPAFSYAMVADGLDTFGDRNEAVFGRVTGFNPRLTNAVLDEADPFIAEVRRTQQLVMDLFDKRYGHAPAGGGTETLDYTADYGVLAGAIGVVKIKATPRHPAMLAMLPTLESGDESAVPNLPVDAKKAKEKFSEWMLPKNEAVRLKQVTETIQDLRKMRLPLPANCDKAIDTARFKHAEYGREAGSEVDEWCLVDGDGERVAWRNARTSQFACKRLEPVSFAAGFAALRMRNELCVEHAASHGIRDNAETECKAIMHEVPLLTLLRLKGILRTQHGDFKLPVPARDGGLAADELAAMPFDWDVWRLIVLFAVQVPEALWAGQLPRFRVRSTVTGNRLLRRVYQWVTDVTDVRAAAETSGRAELTPREEASRGNVTLREHQKDAFEQLVKSNRPNNVLVMKTGMGKTYTALAYALYRLPTSMASFMLWFAPSNVLRDIEEMATNLGIECFRTTKRGKGGQTELAAALEQRQHRLYLVDRDMARSIPDSLLDIAPHAYCVFDELDSYFGSSQRSSIMLAIAGVASGFLGMTATPYANRNDVGRLCTWLGLCVDFPVTKENLIVAMSSCVQITATHDIQKRFVLEGIPADPEVFSRYEEVADSPHELYKMLRHYLDPHFARTIARISESDDVFVVCDGREHCVRVQQLVQQHTALKSGIYQSAADTVLTDASYRIVYVPKNMDRGYNGGERFRQMVRQVYGMGLSARLQMEGRLVRLKQKAPVVTYTTVYFNDTSMAAALDRKMREEISALQSAAVESGEKKRKR